MKLGRKGVKAGRFLRRVRNLIFLAKDPEAVPMPEPKMAKARGGEGERNDGKKSFTYL